MLAMARGRADICQLLLDEGADPRLTDAAGRSTLAYAQADASWISSLDLGVAEAETDGSPSEERSPLTDSAPAEADLAQPASEAVETLQAPEAVGDSGWEPEEVSQAPDDDGRLRLATAELQTQIGRHRAIDSDPDWADVEIHLPAPKPLRVRNPVRQRELERLRHLFRHALAHGSYGRADVESALVGDPAQDEGAGRRLGAALDTLAALGVVAEDWEDWRPAGTPGGLRLHAERLDEACEHFELHWSREDIVEASLRRLAKHPPLKPEQEREAWRRYDLGLQSLYAAIVETPAACAALASALRAHARKLVWSDRDAAPSAKDDADDREEDLDDEPARADVPVQGWSEERLAAMAALLDDLSNAAAPDQAPPRKAFLKAVGERRLPASLIVGVAHLQGSAAAKAAAREFLKARDHLFETNNRLAMWVARRYGWSGLPLEDRFQEASQGLLKAIDRYDPLRGNRFSSYAIWWIRQSVTRAIQDQERVIRLPVHLQDTLRRAERQTESLFYELGREPTLGELAVRLGLPQERLSGLLRARLDAVPLDDLVDEEGRRVPALQLAANDHSPEERVSRAQLETVIRAMLVELSPREERIVRQRFGMHLKSDMTLEEIGVTVDVTRERIRQIEAKALRRMAHPGRSRRLRAFLGAGA